MKKNKTSIIQVPVTEDTIKKIDKLAEKADASRAAIVRRAIALLIDKECGNG